MFACTQQTHPPTGYMAHHTRAHARFTWPRERHCGCSGDAAYIKATPHQRNLYHLRHCLSRLLASSLPVYACVCVCTPTSARARAHAPPPTYVEFYSTSASPTLSIHMGTTPSVHDRLDCACVQSKRCPLDYHQCYARRRACVLRAHAPDDQSFLSFCVRALSFLFVSPLVLLYCIRHYPPLD